MEFKPLYFANKLRQTKPGDPFDKEKINLINPFGSAGILTLWTKPWDVWEKIQRTHPSLLEQESPLVTLTSLYGNGIPQMLANLAHNPQITRLAVTGKDTPVVPSWTYLKQFFEGGVEQGKIKGTEFPLDEQLSPHLFKHLTVQRFTLEELTQLSAFVTTPEHSKREESERKSIILAEPVFKDFPSDKTNHAITAETPLKAWLEVLYHLDRFGTNVELEKGKRRALYNLKVTITNPSPEDPGILEAHGFDWTKLQAYRKDMLTSPLPEGIAYTYGNRIGAYFNVHALENVIKRLQRNPLDRRGYITTWDNKHDILAQNESDSSVPCLTGLYFATSEGKLVLQADFRTHAATSGWLLNCYGLRALQERVSEETRIPLGQLSMLSRWIGIDPDDAKTNNALNLVAKNRKVPLNVHDPRGYCVIETEEKRITCDHYAQDGRKLKRYEGETALDIKNQLRQDRAFSDPDHTTWIGMQLAAAHYKIHTNFPE